LLCCEHASALNPIPPIFINLAATGKSGTVSEWYGGVHGGPQSVTHNAWCSQEKDLLAVGRLRTRIRILFLRLAEFEAL